MKGTKLTVSIGLVLVLIASILLAACAPAAPTAPAPTTPAPTKPAPTTPAPAKPAPTTPAPAKPAPSPAAEVTTWKLVTHMVTAQPSYRTVRNIQNTLEAMSDGRFVIKDFSQGAIVPPYQELDAVETGLAQASISTLGMSTRDFLGSDLCETVPGGMISPELYLWVAGGGGRELWDRLVDKVYGGIIKRIGYGYLQPPEVWVQSSVPITSLADLMNMKMRAVGGAGEIVAQMGVPAVVLPGGEVYEACARGVIEALEREGIFANWAYGYHEVAPYVYLDPSRCPVVCGSLFVETDAWTKLTPDIQAMLAPVVDKEGMDEYARQAREEAEALQWMIDYGCTINTLPADISEAFMVAAEKWLAEREAEDPLFSEILDSRRAFRKALKEANLYHE